MDSTGGVRLLRFGVFEIDLRTRELRKQGRKINLQEQPFQVLIALLEQPHEMVTREVLQKRLWPNDTFVDFDHSLNTVIMRLREAFGETADNPVFIETLPRRGYRFIAPVEELSGQGAGAAPLWRPVPLAETETVLEGTTPQTRLLPEKLIAPPVAGSSSWRSKLIVAALATALLAFISVLAARSVRRPATTAGKSTPGPIHSVAVLALENLSSDKEQEYFAQGITDELIVSLAKIRELRVISRSSAMEYKERSEPLDQIGRELNVDAILKGTVRRANDRVRISVELVQVPADRHLWAQTYEGNLADVLSLQSGVARRIANEIKINLTPQEQEGLTRGDPVNAEAHEAYLKGHYYWKKRTDKEGVQNAIYYFQHAIESDPKYALAYAGLADCYDILAAVPISALPTAEVAPKAQAAARRAVELDDTLAEARTSLATVSFNYDWDWPAAEEGFLRARALNPGYNTTHERYSLYLAAMGRTDESIAEINRAMELDPGSLSINFSTGWSLYLARRYDQAIRQLLNTLEMDPNDALAHLALGQAYEQTGTYDRAVTELQKAMVLSGSSPHMMAELGYALAVEGKKNQARHVLEQLRELSNHRYVSPFYIATVYTGLGEKDKAIAWLEKAYQDRSNGLVFARVNPELDSLRLDPRFMDLLQRVGVQP
jgi:TolB-like protein/DNA-binding winged helix-turn-helix (wHTH) protein/Flp pilus assembly protein TadD